MTPMIDVMIFLIVFFLAATNFAEIEREQDLALHGDVARVLALVREAGVSLPLIDPKQVNLDRYRSAPALPRAGGPLRALLAAGAGEYTTRPSPIRVRAHGWARGAASR